jgi:hypothetical protein
MESGTLLHHTRKTTSHHKKKKSKDTQEQNSIIPEPPTSDAMLYVYISIPSYYHTPQKRCQTFFPWTFFRTPPTTNLSKKNQKGACPHRRIEPASKKGY